MLNKEVVSYESVVKSAQVSNNVLCSKGPEQELRLD